MNTENAIAVFLLATCAAIVAGLFMRMQRVQARERRPGEPSLLEKLEAEERVMMSGRPARIPLIDSYAGAVRLQRATVAAEIWMDGRDKELPGGPLDLAMMTQAIVAAWIGDDEPPMVSVPIMKLGEIKVDREAELKARRLRAVNESRERLDLPPLVTLDPPPSGGLVEPRRRPFIVGEQPSETIRRRPSDRKLDPEQ